MDQDILNLQSSGVDEQPAKILVVDDEEIMRNLLKDLLSDMSYDVVTAANGEEGLYVFDKGSFDVLIADLRMPGMDGIKFLEQIKQRDPDAVVIIITGYGALKSSQEALRLGAFDYITKPFELTDITFIVKRATQARRLVVSNKQMLKYLEKRNFVLDKKVSDRTKELEVLYRVGRKINSLDEDHILNDVVNTLVESIGLRVCSIFIHNPDQNVLMLKAAYGIRHELINKMKVNPSEEISGYVFEKEQAILVNNSPEDFGTLTEELKIYDSSIISVPIKIKEKVAGVINVSGRISGEKFSLEDFDLVKEVATLIGIGLDSARLYKSLQDLYLRVVTSLVSAIDAKDSYTRSHSENVAKIGEKIARKLKLSESDVRYIKLAGQLHDIGKIGIKDAILTKPDPLSDEEWNEMRTHSDKAVEILGPLRFLKDVVLIVKHNHERYDGKGYPDGLKGEQIELGSRIIALADAYDTMISKRPYRGSIFSSDKIIEEFNRCRGAQFDPNIVDVFIEMIKNKEI